jgi:hypothetical protein
MSDLTEATPQQGTTSLAGSDRDMQRAALRDLVRLAADAAIREIEIEKTYRVQLQQAEKQLNKSIEEIEHRHETRKAELAAGIEQKISTVAQSHQAAKADLTNFDSTSRKRIAHDHDRVKQDLKSKLQQAVWLAESVLEATQNQIAKEYKKAKEDHENQLAEVSELMNKSSQIVSLYGMPQLVTTVALNPPPQGEPAGPYDQRRDAVKLKLAQFERLPVPRMFVGMKPIFIVAGICVLAMGITQWMTGGIPGASYGETVWKTKEMGIALGGAALFCVIVGILLRILAKKHVRAAYVPLRESIEAARRSADQALADAKADREMKTTRAHKKKDGEVQAAKDKVAPYEQRNDKNRDTALQTYNSDFARRTAQIEEKHKQTSSEAQQWRQRAEADVEQAYRGELAAARQTHEQQVAASNQQHDQARADLETRWNEGLAEIQRPIERHQAATDGQLLNDWDDPRWKNWHPPKVFPQRVRFGELHVDLKQITDKYPRELTLPPTFSVPATLAFPKHASMVIHTDHAGRAEAIRTQQMLMSRLLTQLPAGRVRFTIIDPVGLGQNFAGFMHLADHDEALVGSRIWTESEHIEQQLANLTEHMETVIQKYLRNEFETIDDYNAQAGELAEPYRYLIIADFPVGFEGDAFRRLNSIATSGARCGVFFIIVRDTRHGLQSGVHLDELDAHAINLIRKGDTFVWKDEIFKQFPLQLDDPPSEEFLTQTLEVVGKQAKEAKRVEVAFKNIAPPPEKVWTGDSGSDIEVPIGRLGATRLQLMKLGRGVAQHALIAGKTGSGKSTLLHVLVTNLALWYGPDQVEFYLVDFKKGVEFKTYATHVLPHARAIAVESDREFGLSVLQRIDAELARRGEIYRRLGVQDLAAYRAAAPDKPMPRTLLMIDEFQEFFSEDDKLAQEAGLLLDRLVRQGRAFGIHVLLGSQTIGGTSGLARSTIGQMAVRIALQTSEADSQLILGDTNSAARLLSRPGEAIYNDAGGLVEGNSPFQISWLPDEEREVYLDTVRQRALKVNDNHPEPIVFEGNAPADITRNRRLSKAIETPPASRLSAPLIWLGDPVAIKEPTSIALRAQSGSNVMIIGQHEEAAMALLASSMISLSSQHPKGTAKFYLLDGTPADSTLAGVLERIAAVLQHEIKHVEWRDVPQAIDEIAKEVQSRQAAEHHGDLPSIYVLIYGLQRYRMLRKSEESFGGFSMDDAEKKPQPDKQFSDILREGPSLGVHVISWTDTQASLDRTLDRGSMREFDNRVLFQMSAADSSNLIDSPAANKLGFHRALVFSEEQGVMEKFRPYALPAKGWLEQVRSSLGQR